MNGFSGGCLCGSITYTSQTNPLGIVNCHCTSCRKSTGAVYGTNLFIDDSNLKILGSSKLQEFLHKADSGNELKKQFCKTCGTLLFSYSSGRQNIVAIRAGTVNEKEVVCPKMNVYTDSMIPSTPLDPSLNTFVKMPPLKQIPGMK